MMTPVTQLTGSECWAFIQPVVLLSSLQLIAGWHTLTITFIHLDGGRKYTEGTHRDTRRTCRLHAGWPRPRTEPRPAVLRGPGHEEQPLPLSVTCLLNDTLRMIPVINVQQINDSKQSVFQEVLISDISTTVRIQEQVMLQDQKRKRGPYTEAEFRLMEIIELG